MNKSFLCLLLILGFSFSGFSQEFSYGLKGGVSYALGGTITSTQERYFDGSVDATPKTGFHGGAFLQVNWGKFFVRPEFVYSSLEREYAFPRKPSVQAIEKFDIPLLIGYNIWGPVDIYAGGSYSNIQKSTLEGEEHLDRVVVENFPINAHAGVKLEFGRFGIDFRYDHSLSSQELQNLDLINSEYGINEAVHEDSRMNQFIVSVTFKIGGPGLNERRRRACY